MNGKNIAKFLKKKMDDWVSNIQDENIKTVIRENALITGGALVSLLTGEEPNDYDVYFKTRESCDTVARYYADVWNANHPDKQVEVKEDVSRKRIMVFLRSEGVISVNNENGIDDETEPDTGEAEAEAMAERPKYRPRYFTTNAISLSDKIQLVIRFYGDVSEIHTNYDFIHCTCSYDYKTNKVELPARALEAIINKELFYCGSKYPLCSIIRTRKFIARGWTINAGQYLKMCLQLNTLNLHNLSVLADQLVGVDSAYFALAIKTIKEKQEKEPEFQIDNKYLFEIINRIF